jgi:hypothetical protein
MDRKVVAMSEACKDCKFYSEFDDGLGMCYRYPPVYIGKDPKHEANEESWSKPTVHEGSWCGEFKKETPQ